MTKVFFIHTIHGMNDLFTQLAGEYFEDAEIYHIADESLIRRILAKNGLTPVLYRRVCDYVVGAEEAGADFIQLTCSSVSPCVDVARKLVSVPVLKIDEAMFRQAVAKYARIGLIATNPATLIPGTELLQSVAQGMEKTICCRNVVCEGAYDALLSGFKDEHDRIVSKHLLELQSDVDVICLAQASMARVVDQISDKISIPVLSSPRPAVEALSDKIKGGD